MHLILDGAVSGYITRSHASDWLLSMPGEIGMTIIRDEGGAPRMHIEEVAKPPQLHGFIFIAESHLALHAERSILLLDIFSCQEFDYTHVINRARQHFGLELLHSWLDVDRLDLPTMRTRSIVGVKNASV